MAIRYIGNKDSDGTSLGQSSTDKISLYGVTPVVQPAMASYPAVTTTSITQTSPFGFATATQGNNLVSLANAIRAAGVTLGLWTT